jgi:choline kinase
MKCVILAAGTNTRFLEHREEGFFKQQLTINGESLICRLLRQTKLIGVDQWFVVCSTNCDSLISHMKECAVELLDSIEFISNSHPERGNGYSLGLALSKIDEPFYLCMSDHVYDDQFFNVVSDSAKEVAGLFVDSKHQQIFDLEDATKVQTNQNRLVHLGKNLHKYDAIDTGFFQLLPNIKSTYHSLQNKTLSLSLSSVIIEYSKSHPFRTFDIGASRWQDVDNEAMYNYAVSLFGA